MAKSTMNKVSKKVAKMDKSTLAIILVSLALVIVVTVILVRKSKREGFALMDLSNASFVTQGEDGAQGADGAQGVDGANGAVGPEGPSGDDYIPSQEDKNALYDEFKGKIMKEMVQNKLIVKEGTEENPKYLPVGVIGLKTNLLGERIELKKNDLKMTKLLEFDYDKQSTRSIIKVSYTLNMTGYYFHRGATFRLFVKEQPKPKQISATACVAGVWSSESDRRVPKSVDITGIDYTPEVGKRTYFLKVDLLYARDPTIVFNRLNWADRTGYLNEGNFLKSSVSVEEVVLADFNENEKGLPYVKQTSTSD